MNEIPVLQIPQVMSGYIDKLIETRGLVVLFRAGLIKLQEKSSVINKTGTLPLSILVEVSKETVVQVGDYVKVIGVPQIKKKKGSSAAQIIIQCQEIVIISDDEADISINQANSFFVPENLKEIIADSAIDLIQKLKTKATEEGFKLVQVNSSKDNKVKLRCYLHTKKGKDPLLNTGCNFYINIREGHNESHVIWRVTSFELCHNHINDPFVYLHKLVSPNTRKLIFTLMKNGVDSQVISKILGETIGQMLSSAQIAEVCRGEKKIKRLLRVAESEELRNHMLATNGHFLYDDSEDTEDIIKRKVFATFTSEELENLRLFGDFVSIDPTYCSMSSNWTIIPLTVIGYEREIRSAGLVFASSTKSEIFRWLLAILVSELPCKNILTTICSDDDVGLAGAFAEAKMNEGKNEIDEKISRLNRVICYWHKIENFIKYIVTLHLPQDEEKKYIQLFRIMGMTRDKVLAEKCHSKLEENTKIKEYMIQNVNGKLNMMMKSSIDYFTCGYNTSSISESANRRMKRILPDRPQTLKEIREHLTFTENNSRFNKRFVKGRKLKKVKSKYIVDIMSNLNVAETIAESISGSISKSQNLEIKFSGCNSATIIEKKNNCNEKEDNELSTETYIIKNGKCSCLKQESAGLPCSHIIRFLMEKGENLYESLKINDRWIIHQPNDITFSTEISKKITIEKPNVAPSDDVERFVILKAKANALVSVASKVIQCIKFYLMHLSRQKNSCLKVAYLQ